MQVSLFGGIGGKGAGESSLELDRRRVRDRIAELKRELVTVQRELDTRRARRQQQDTVALVGYTNAGKSSLMRKLTGSEVLVRNQLFATLETTVRVLKPETQPRILVSDTVGFLKKMGDASWGLLRKGTEAGHGLVLKSNQGDRLITNRADLIKWKVARGGKGAAYHPGGTYEYSLVCKGTCCSVGVADEDGHYGTHMVTGNINEVCYWPISSTEAYVRSIKVWENEMYND